MIKPINRSKRRKLIQRRIRRKISGTADRPRLAVSRSLNHFYLQAVDDDKGATLCSASTIDAEVRKQLANGGNIAAASMIGDIIASKLKDKDIERVVFDRGGYRYHGRVKAAAEAARKKGLKF